MSATTTPDLRQAVTALQEAVHALAQPLTALAFVVEIARMQTDPALWRSSLDSASEECRRAMVCLEMVRGTATVLCADADGGAA